jgi:hypothetical protein
MTSCNASYVIIWASPGSEVKGPLVDNAGVNELLDEDIEARDEWGSPANDQAGVVTHQATF